MVEFAFMIPLVIGMIITLREVNMAINSSIVNQKWAGSTLHFLLFNHRWYPEQGRTVTGNDFMGRWWVGVNDTTVPAISNNPPHAPTIKVGRVPGSEDPGIHVQDRQNVRIRASAFICLPPRGVLVDHPFAPGFMTEGAFNPGGFVYCNK